MSENMGQIIRRLRKECNLTQEELARKLGVTFQAVSKWENNSGMPDISHIAPLARVFGVSTDVLLGNCEAEDTKAVLKLILDANALVSVPPSTESVRRCYDALLNGLKKYPDNAFLLLNCLETGMTPAYPENEIYDSENGESIYKECIRQADFIIKHGKNGSDILRAHKVKGLEPDTVLKREISLMLC